MINTDLFGNPVTLKEKNVELRKSVTHYDSETLNERVERLKFINEISSGDTIVAGDTETVYIFKEVKMAYLGGNFISTILLTQAFIERLLASHFNSINLERIANRGIKAMLDYAKKHKLFKEYFINQIDRLRQKRNPFVHLKPFEHKFNVSQRIMSNMQNDNKYISPDQLIEEDAKEAIRLMYAIFVYDLKT